MKKQIITYSHSLSQNIVIFFVAITLLSQCTPPEKLANENRESKKELSEKILNVNDIDSLQTILQLFVEEDDEVGKMLAYKQLGSLQLKNNNFSEAINNHQRGLEIALALNDTTEIVQAMNSLGRNFRYIGGDVEAFEYHNAALQYSEEWSGLHTDEGAINRSISFNGIGNVYLMHNLNDDAEKQFRKSLEDISKLNRPIGQAVNFGNLGRVFENRQLYDSAKAYYDQSLDQYIIAKSDVGVAQCHINLGNLYEKQKMYELAKSKYEKACRITEKTFTHWLWIDACLALAHIDLTTKNYSEFNHYIQLAESTASRIKSLHHLSEISLLKHDYSIMQGKYDQALSFYKQHEEIKNRIQNIRKANRFVDITMRNKQNKNNEKLKEIETKSKLEVQKTQYRVNSMRVITIIIFIMLVLLYYVYNLGKRSNKTLKRLASTRSDFFTNITHELRTPLTVIQGLNRQMQQRKDLTEKETTVFREAIDRQSSNLLNLVNQLLDLAKLKSGVDEPQWRRGDIIAYLEMTAEAYTLYAKEKGITLIFYSDLDSKEMDFIPSYIDIIVTNLLSNAIKHTEAGGKIDFIIIQEQSADTITIRVSDTGEGIPKEHIEHIFDLFYQNPNAKNISGTGIGLAFTQMMVEKMKGKIKIESELGQGSVFTINLPTTNKKLRYIPPLLKEKKTFTSQIENQKNTIVKVEETEVSDEKAINILPLIPKNSS